MEWREGEGRAGQGRAGQGRAGQGRAGQGARLLRWTFTGRDFIPLNTPVERAAASFSQIMRHYTHHSFIAETQHRFLKGLCCDTQLVTTIEQLQKGMDHKHHQKAFDKVPHRHLLNKLEASGVRVDEHEWLRTYLTSRARRVVVGGRASKEVPVLSGVPQGTVLWRPMFLTNTNDINRNISGTMTLFADDALLFHQIRSDADCLSLQKDVDTLYSWARKWRMQSILCQ